MRILQVFNEYRQRGGEEVWVDKLPELLGVEFEVRDLRFRSTDWTGSNAPSKWRQIRWISDNPESRRRLRTMVAEFEPAVLLFHNLIPVASLGLYDEARKLGIPVVQYIHNYRPFSPSGTLWVNGRLNDAAMRGNSWPEVLAGAWSGSRLRTAILAWHLWRLRESGVLDSVKIWIAISEFMRSRFIEAGIPEDRVVVLPHCVFDSACPAEDVEKNYYVFVGRLSVEKGIATLLLAWRILARQMAMACPRLVIAGEGPLVDNVRREVEVSNHVEYVGFVDGESKRRLIRESRGVVFPSEWWEPLGLVIYEAYAQQRPVVASRVAGMAESVLDGVTGGLFTPGEPEDLVREVRRIEDIGVVGRRKMGVDASRWLQANRSQEEWKERMTDVLSNL